LTAITSDRNLSTLVLFVLSIPLFDIRLGSADAGNNPTSSTMRRAYDRTAEAFGPGANGPLQIVVNAGDESELQLLRQAISADDGVASVREPLTSPDGRLTIFSVIPESAPQDGETTDLVHRLRNETIPRAVGAGDADVYVAGTTARYIDIADRIGARLPLFFAIVIGISFLLLTMVGRRIRRGVA